MSKKRTDISERLLQTLQEIEANDRNSNFNVGNTVVPEMDSILHRSNSYHNVCRHQKNQSKNNYTNAFEISAYLSKFSKEPKGILGVPEEGEDTVLQNVKNNLNFSDQSFNLVIPKTLANKQEQLLTETSGIRESFSTVQRNFKSKSSLDDGHDDEGSSSGLSSVAHQLENIRESQDAILADIRIDMEQLHMDNLALRQNSAKFLAERNHYEKLYDEISKNLQMIKEQIRQIQSSPNSVVDVELQDTINPNRHENFGSCNNETFSFCEPSSSSQHFLKNPGRTERHQELLDQYNFMNYVPSPATEPEITKNCANHSLSSATNYEPASELQLRNRLALKQSVVQEKALKKSLDDSLSTYLNAPNTLSTTPNSLKQETHTRKELLTYSQTSEISQTESTLTPLSGQSVGRLKSNNSSGSSNASVSESILQARSVSNKTSKKTKMSKVKTGCFEFLRRRKNKKPN